MKALEAPRLTRPGFWYERIRYRSLPDSDVLSAAYYATTNPAQAIRRIRVEVRTLVSVLPTKEMLRALAWVEGDGCIGAVGALHRGEPCGFSLSTHDAWIEWTVRPVLFLPLANVTPFEECPPKKRQSGNHQTHLTLVPPSS